MSDEEQVPVLNAEPVRDRNEAEQDEVDSGGSGHETVALDVLNNRILGPNDPRRMQLSREEREWALDIKDVIEGTPEIDKLSDFMYAQLAIIHQDDIATAVEIASRLQHTREEYDIRDTLDDGIVKLPKMLDLNPGCNLSFSFSHETGRYVHVLDLARVDMRVMQHVQIIRSLASAYYMYHSLNPDLEAVRRGIIMIVECEGYEWMPKAGGLQYNEQFWTNLGGVYPWRIKQFKFFHTPMFLNILKSMTRPFVPDDIYSSIETGCQFEGRLSSVYLVPSLEVAAQRFLERAIDNLRLRYENEKAFSLS